eukprot:1158208-Pelagomonas_calceolata.AAC.34
MSVTGAELNLAEDVFKLQHLLDANLLRHREEVEELTGAAVKEEQIETKLASIQADWATINLVFADCKTRGPVILKGSDTADLIEKLEDSQVGSVLQALCAHDHQGLTPPMIIKASATHDQASPHP